MPPRAEHKEDGLCSFILQLPYRQIWRLEDLFVLLSVVVMLVILLTFPLSDRDRWIAVDLSFPAESVI